MKTTCILKPVTENTVLSIPFNFHPHAYFFEDDGMYRGKIRYFWKLEFVLIAFNYGQFGWFVCHLLSGEMYNIKRQKSLLLKQKECDMRLCESDDTMSDATFSEVSYCSLVCVGNIKIRHWTVIQKVPSSISGPIIMGKYHMSVDQKCMQLHLANCWLHNTQEVN